MLVTLTQTVEINHSCPLPELYSQVLFYYLCRITEKMASEVSRAGILKKLMELIDSEDDKLSHQAFTIFLPLTDHPQSAALIGASDGVDFFFSHLDSPRKHITRKELISGLCQLAREAVNRAKMRLLGGLKVFLESLQDDTLVEVQDRVISCLVNFLYDDISLSAMLEEGLVDVLLTHLQRCGGYTSDLSVNLYESTVELMQPVEKSSQCAAPHAPLAVVDVSGVNESSAPTSKSSDEGSTGDFGSKTTLPRVELATCAETSQLERCLFQTSETSLGSTPISSTKNTAVKPSFDGGSLVKADVSHNQNTPKEEQDAVADGVEEESATAQTNILILLFRLSMCDDLSKHLSTSKVICCLTDHLALANEPHDRCVRILSRILSSPHCLTPLLKMCATATLVKMLMLDSDSTMASYDAVRGAAGSHVSRHLSCEEQDMKSLMRMSTGIARSFSTEATLPIPKVRSDSNLMKSSSAFKAGHTSSESGRKHRSTKPGPNEDKPDSYPRKRSHDLARVGAKLLGDLSNQAMTPYGEGVILYTFHSAPASLQLVFATSLLFLQTHWYVNR